MIADLALAVAVFAVAGVALGILGALVSLGQHVLERWRWRALVAPDVLDRGRARMARLRSHVLALSPEALATALTANRVIAMRVLRGAPVHVVPFPKSSTLAE